MAGAWILVLFFVGAGFCLAAEDPQTIRSPRTIARFFGLESSNQAQPQQQQQQQAQQAPGPSQVRKPVPLIYSVKYYDRTGEGEKIEVIPEVQDRVQGVPARVFLNLYTGQPYAGQLQQTAIYYDNKGQILVPCPVYDHLYVAGVDQGLVRKPSPQKAVQAPVTVASPQVAAPPPEIVYYATPSFVGGNPQLQQQKPGSGFTVVGVPYDYPYFPGLYPYGPPGAFNPYVYIKPTPNGQHAVPLQAQQNHQQPHQAVEKKEGEKTD